MRSRIADVAAYRRYEQKTREGTFQGFASRMYERAERGEPEYQLRKDRFIEKRALGWSVEQAYKYAEHEGWQRRSDIGQFGPCPGCGIRAKTPKGEPCEVCAPREAQ